MKSYAIAEKPGELMHQLAKGYDEQTMHRIALWFQNTPEPKP
jgi:cytochrome c553